MSREEILKAVIEQAVANGWKPAGNDGRYVWPPESIEVSASYGDNGETGWTLITRHKTGITYQHLKLADSDGAEDLLFDHEFAKALFGEEETQRPMTISGAPFGRLHVLETKVDWQYHLQQMVVSPDPIAYLGEWLKGETND